MQTMKVSAYHCDLFSNIVFYSVDVGLIVANIAWGLYHVQDIAYM